MVSGGGQEVARFQAVLGFDASGFNSGITQAQNTWNRFGQAMLSGVGIGAGFAAVTTAVRGLSQAVQTSVGNVMSYETAFTGIRKTVDGTAADFAALDRNIRGLAAAGPIGRDELAGIGQMAGQLGVRGVDNLTKFIDTVAKIGTATNLSTQEAALGLGRFAQVMGEPIAKVDVLASGMVGLGNTMRTSGEQEILQFANRIMGMGKVAGLTSAQVMALSAATAEVGVEAEAGGSAVSLAIGQMMDAVSKGGDELKVFAAVSGVTTEQFKQQWERDAFGAFVMFEEGLKRSGPLATQALDAVGLGGIRARQALLGLSQDTDRIKFALDTYTTSAAGAKALTEEYGKFSETTASKVKEFKNNVVELADTIGGPLIDMINRALPHLQSFTAALAGGDASGGGKSGGFGAWLRWQAGGAGDVLKNFGGDLAKIPGILAWPWKGGEGPGIGGHSLGTGLGNVGGAIADWMAPPGGWSGSPADVSGVAKFGGTPAAEMYADSVTAIERATTKATSSTDKWQEELAGLLKSLDDGTKKMSDAERAEKALAEARKRAAEHVEDVMTTRLVEAYIKGGDAQVAAVRTQNDALLAEFNSMLPKFKELGMEIPNTAIDMFLAIKDEAKRAAEGMARDFDSARRALFGPAGSENDDMLRSWAGSGAKVYRHPNGSQGAYKPGTEPSGYQLLFDPATAFTGPSLVGPGGAFDARPMADGGIVMPRPGGTLARIAEAGRPEAVIPLGPSGKMGGEVHFHFHGAVGDQRAIKTWVQQAYEDLKSEGAI